MNKDTPIWRLFPPLPIYSECFIDTRTRSKITNEEPSSDIFFYFSSLIPICFENNRLEFIPLNSILHENEIINCLPESLRENEIPSTV